MVLCGRPSDEIQQALIGTTCESPGAADLQRTTCAEFGFHGHADTEPETPTPLPPPEARNGTIEVNHDCCTVKK